MKLTIHKEDVLVKEFDSKDYIGPENEENFQFFLGRADDCHVQFDSQKVSRYHAIISENEGKWIISKKALFGVLLVNGLPITTKELHQSDLITIPPYMINFSMSSSERQSMKMRDFETHVQTSTLQFGESNDTTTDKKDNLLENNTINETKNTFEEKNDFDNNFNNDFDNDFDKEVGGDFEVRESDQFAAEKNEQVQLDEQTPVDSIPSSESSDTDDFFVNENNEDADPLSEDPSNEMADFPSDSFESDDQTREIAAFAKFSLKIFGENAPYDQYTVVDTETFIGRDSEKCQIVLQDSEVSSIHAVIKKSFNSLTLEDLDSSNGTILNGNRINKIGLNYGDEFIIGSTTFTVIIESEIIKAEENRLMPIAENQEIEIEEIVEEEVDFGKAHAAAISDEGGDFKPTSNSLFSKDSLKDPKKRVRLLIIGVVIMGLWLLLGEDPETESTKTKGPEKKSYRLTPKGEESTDKGADKGAKVTSKKELTPELIDFLSQSYTLAKTYFAEKKFKEAEMELNKILQVYPEGYKNTIQLKNQISEIYKQIAEMEAKKRKEEAERIKQIKIQNLLKKAEEAVKDKRVELAEGLFNEILSLDPEQSDVNLLKMELDAWKKEKERKEVEEEMKKAERRRKVAALQKGKNPYLKKEWYIAINKLENFLTIQEMDEDLIKEGTEMLEDAKQKLADMIDPLLGEARSLKEGQDLKGAYALYKEILKINPSHAESLIEMDSIRSILERKSMILYREAIIYESLSLFQDAKEKLQEVQNISPKDSVYYNKATNKLKEYLR